MIAHTLSLLLLSAQPSHVDRVVVFPDRAQVTRAAAVSCQGRTQVRFEGIPPTALAESFRASAEGAKVEGLRSLTRTRVQAYSQKIADLEARSDALTAQLATLDDEDGRARNLSQLGTQFEQVAVQLISRDLAVSKPDPKGWGRAFDLSEKAWLDGSKKSVDVATRRRVLGWQLEDVRASLSTLQTAAQRREKVAEVLVACPAGQRATVKLTYFVGGASWQPRYEARMDEAQGAVELSTWATVAQRTGEDWTGAHLVLSTAIPSQDATPPEIQPLKVYAEPREEEKKVLVRREEQIRHAEAGELEGAKGNAELPVQAQGLSVQLQVPEAADVPGDGAPVKVFVAKNRMAAKFAARTAPTLAPFVFRVADLTNRAPFPLLPGELEAFGHSGLVGRYALDRVPRGGLFHLTFGVEDSVRVKRTVLQEVQREEGFFNHKRRFTYRYRFELSNYAKDEAQVDLRDRIPVSELDDVEVAIDESTTPGFKLEKEDGIVRWRVKLPPKGKRAFELAFHVDVPESYQSAGL